MPSPTPLGSPLALPREEKFGEGEQLSAGGDLLQVHLVPELLCFYLNGKKVSKGVSESSTPRRATLTPPERCRSV